MIMIMMILLKILINLEEQENNDADMIIVKTILKIMI